jgi:hypothetical protein
MIAVGRNKQSLAPAARAPAIAWKIGILSVISVATVSFGMPRYSGPNRQRTAGGVTSTKQSVGPHCSPHDTRECVTPFLCTGTGLPSCRLFGH